MKIPDDKNIGENLQVSVNDNGKQFEFIVVVSEDAKKNKFIEVPVIILEVSVKVPDNVENQNFEAFGVINEEKFYFNVKVPNGVNSGTTLKLPLILPASSKVEPSKVEPSKVASSKVASSKSSYFPFMSYPMQTSYSGMTRAISSLTQIISSQ